LSRIPEVEVMIFYQHHHIFIAFVLHHFILFGHTYSSILTVNTPSTMSDTQDEVMIGNKVVFKDLVLFKVSHSPRTKARPYFCKAPFPRVVNRSARNENTFLEAAKEAIEKGYHNPKFPLFKKSDHMVIKVITRRARPLSHYVNGDRHRGVLKAKFSGALMPPKTGGDVDNYVKLVQDALQCSKDKKDGLYFDDSQIIFQCGVKVWDDEGDCTGGTTVSIKRVAGKEGEAYIKNHFLGMM
jgi:Holliday junction resolvase RusA-like endonuclease